MRLEIKADNNNINYIQRRHTAMIIYEHCVVPIHNIYNHKR